MYSCYYRICLLIVLTVGIAIAQVQVTVATDSVDYHSGDTITIYISAHNPDTSALTLEFSSSCQAEYYLGNWNSQVSPNHGCYLSHTWVTIPPESSFTWTKIHLPSDTTLEEGVYPVVGYLQDANSFFSAPVFITIGTPDSTRPEPGFYPPVDSLILFGDGCTMPVIMVSLQEQSLGADLVSIEALELTSVLVKFTTGSGSYWQSFPNAYFYVPDPLDEYSYTVTLLLDSTEIVVPLDSVLYFDSGQMVMKVIINSAAGHVDSLFQPLLLKGGLGVDPETPLAQNLFLLINYPNPFNSATVIRYRLPHQTHINLAVYDLLGREVTVLRDEIQPAGFHAVYWNAGEVASGIYFYRLTTPNRQITHKCVVLK